jgi:hypothetical protein
MKTRDYLKLLYDTASAGSTKASVTKKVAEKIRKNANDVGSRITSSGLTSDDVKDGKVKPTLREAIELAQSKLESE